MVRHQIHVVLSMYSAMGREALRGLAAYAHRQHEWRLNTQAVHQLKHGQVPSPGTADAVIGTISSKVAEAWQGAHRGRVVNVSRSWDVPGAANVTCDDALIGRMAAEYLLEKGLKQFGWAGPGDVRLRFDAFAATLRRHGYEVSKRLPPTEHFAEDAVAWINGSDGPCGVLAFNDWTAMDLMEVADRFEIGVPERAAIMGVDNDELNTMFASAGVTSVDPDFFEVGRRAGEMLDALLRGADPPKDPIRIPPKGIVERESTDFPGHLDAVAVQAARLIRREALCGTNVNEIVDQLPVTRRTAIRRFGVAFGRSMHDEITRVRLDEAKRLLSGTALPIEEIATRSGYAGTPWFSKTFRKHVGMPPSEYRRAACQT